MPSELTVRSGRVKHARRLATKSFRAETAEFLAEGPQAVREALHAGLVREIFITPEADERYGEFRGFEDSSVVWNVVADDVIAHIADSVSPQGVVARCTQARVGLAQVLAHDPKLLVVCADIRDPGNAGSVIRAADAAGADAVVFVGDSVDPWNPKAVRASVGSLFHLPLVIERDADRAITAVRSAGLQILAADGTGEVNLFDAELRGPTAWLMGNEAWGLPGDILALADSVVAIPIYGRAESLNLATAAALCLYASAQAQR